jgi:hypothetical protein
MAQRKTTKRNRTAKPKEPTVAEQEGEILSVYVDMIENDNLDDVFDLARHASIDISRGDPLQAVLRHYWLGSDRGYDVKRAIEDFASWPPIVARGEELRKERRRSGKLQ